MVRKLNSSIIEKYYFMLKTLFTPPKDLLQQYTELHTYMGTMASDVIANAYITVWFMTNYGRLPLKGSVTYDIKENFTINYAKNRALDRRAFLSTVTSKTDTNINDKHIVDSASSIIMAVHNNTSFYITKNIGYVEYLKAKAVLHKSNQVVRKIKHNNEKQAKATADKNKETWLNKHKISASVIASVIAGVIVVVLAEFASFLFLL